MDSFEARLNGIEKSFARLNTEHEKFSFLFASLQSQDEHEGVPFSHLYGHTNNPTTRREPDAELQKETQAILRLLERNNISPASFLSFVTSHDESMDPIWGNVSAIDILGNTTERESFDTRDFTLAFIASGDLRNVIKTVNLLPDGYNGKLNILLNDRNPLVVARNVLILSALSIIDDTDQAVDFALHLWYSVFLPMKGSFLASGSLIQRLVTSHDGQFDLTQTSTMSLSISATTMDAILADLKFGEVDPGTANNALNAVMNAPERVDYRDRVYARLKPSHRVAFQAWRQFGLLMPFGAPNPHLNRPNPSLVTPSGQLWLYDSAIPLAGWDIYDVLKAGREHGTTEEDIIGCLHYHVKDQLTTFSRRLRKFSISFSMYDQNAIELSDTLPLHLRQFDRIEVSNIVDREYVGVFPMLTKWGPLLNRDQPDSTLVASFINWAAQAPGARATHDQGLFDPCLKRLLKVRPDIVNPIDMLRGPASAAMMTAMSSLELVHDTSPAFRKYLTDIGADTAARKAGLRMRERNQIVPPRPYVPIRSEWDALPDISTKEHWYNKFVLSGVNHTERFVEWVLS
uniref:DUF4470 domain-containing protein n=1 Tax=Moniliophthora roreri TaxID=221103 RepID=A0A0W0FAF2_MONRR